MIVNKHWWRLYKDPFRMILIDFEYILNKDKTATLTAWKGTLNGVPSTEMVVPDNENIIL